MRRILIATAVALALTVGAGAPAAAAPAPGAAGIGDSYFPDYGNGGYDVAHYDIRLRYWPQTDQLTGTTTIVATATQELSSFNLDFVLDVSSVRVNNRAAAFARVGDHELVVTPARAIRAGEQITAVIRYAGVPSTVVASGFTSWTRTPDGALAVNEPEIAWWWYPSNDHPRDKATFDVSVLVPDGTEAISNGRLLRQAYPELPGWSRWAWRQTQPQATYLTFLAIGDFDVNVDTSADGSEIVTAYSTALGEHDGAARASVDRTDEVIDWAAGFFGPYPFAQRGGVVVPPFTLGFALETQGRPVYDGAFFRRGANTYVVAHELAHQWFGDSVSVDQWRNIWLNEGFASYAEWLWSEEQGEGTAQELFDFTYASVPADSPFWQVLPGEPGAARIFNGAVYDRGAMAVHAIRQQVGDAAFFQILKDWTASRKFSTGTIEQFQALAEQVSGVDLDATLNTWLFTLGRPELPAPAVAGKAPAAAAGVDGARLTAPRSWAKIQQGRELQHKD